MNRKELRFESVPNPKGCRVIVGCAHTSDGLENLLRSAGELANGKIIAVFGCGGDRDKTKGLAMGELAGRLADLCVITSDHTRWEDSGRTLKDSETRKAAETMKGIEAGLRRTECPYIKTANRKEAIHIALRTAQPEDVVLVAGKDHEACRAIADHTTHFSDKEAVREYFRQTAGHNHTEVNPAM